MSQLIHIADRVLNRPLMIHPDKLALIVSVLEGRIGIDATDLKDLDVDAQLRAPAPNGSRFVGSNMTAEGKRKPYTVSKGGVAVIPVLGSLVNRGAWLGTYSGMTSYEGLGFQLDQAAADNDVRAVILDVDSPGGEAVGCFEVADKVRSLAKSKNVTALVNGMAASAAYAIASAASSIVSTPSGVSGSIGVVLMHADYSGHLEQKGIKPTLIHAGAHKVDGNPYEPLTASVRADLQAEVDQFYNLFVSGVAQGRKGRMTDDAIRNTEARTFIGQAALDARLVDEIGTFDSVLAALSSTSKPTSASSSPVPHSGLSLRGSAPAVDAVRSQVDLVTILAAARKIGREEHYVTLATQHSPEKFPTAAILDVIKIDADVRARNEQVNMENERHACGLWLDPKLTVKNGPLFSAQDEADDRHGWGDIVSRVNKTPS